VMIKINEVSLLWLVSHALATRAGNANVVSQK
jgi:hypothetical protein